MSIAALLAEASAEDEKPRISNLGQVAKLREFASNYASPCIFKVGDLVTPRAESTLRWKGQPHLVIEVLEVPLWAFQTGEVSGHDFGNRLTIRIAKVASGGEVPAFWNEHHQFERYTGDGSQPGDLP